MEDSKLDVEVSEVTDGRLFCVSGILDDMTLASMMAWRGLVAGLGAGAPWWFAGGLSRYRRRKGGDVKILA